VGTDLRAGKTARALDVLRERSCIAEHATTDEAMATLVGRYMADRQSAPEGEWQGLLIATRRADVERLNELVRHTLRGSLGEERTYQTAFGKKGFAVGDRVLTREPHRPTGTVNGDTWTVAGHRDDGRLDLVRERDAARVSWNVQENPALDHGYATTSYRSQGRTVDGAYVLATQAEAQRGMYVDVTRARKSVTIAYGRDELNDFGALLGVVARDRSKLTVAALERGTAREETMHLRVRGHQTESVPSSEELTVLRVTSADGEAAWGAGDFAAYAAGVEASRATYVWRIERGEEKIVFSAGKGGIEDQGHAIVSRGADDLDLRTVLDLTEAKGWKRLRVEGPEHMRAAALTASLKRGCTVEGATDEELERSREQIHAQQVERVERNERKHRRRL
jgi:hypothetical protein